MRIEQLKAFVASAENNSMSIAAEHLYVTPQNISKSINQLEQELKVTLFTRNPQGVILTPMGTKVYTIANEILSRIDYLATKLCPQAIENPATIQGQIKISTSLSLSLFLSTTIADFINDYPNVEFQLSETDHPVPSEAVTQNAYNFIFLSFYNEEIKNYTAEAMQQSYHLYFLKKEKFRLFMNKNSELANKKTISKRTLQTSPLAIYAPNQDDSFLADALIAQLNIKPNKLFKTNNYNFCFQQVVSGNYSALSTNMLYNFCPQSFLAEIVSVPLDTAIELEHYLLVPKTEKAPILDHTFFNLIQSYFKKDFKQIY